MISNTGEQLGIMSLNEAMNLAESDNLDLIEIAPNSQPPVAKIMDWGKYQYQKTKEQQKNRRKSRSNELKQMRIGLKISDNDLEIKLNKVKKFLAKGNKVKIQVVFKGREMAHKELGYQMIERIVNILGDDVITDKKPQMSGRNLSILIRSK